MEYFKNLNLKKHFYIEDYVWSLYIDKVFSGENICFNILIMVF